MNQYQIAAKLTLYKEKQFRDLFSQPFYTIASGGEATIHKSKLKETGQEVGLKQYKHEQKFHSELYFYTHIGRQKRIAKFHKGCKVEGKSSQVVFLILTYYKKRSLKDRLQNIRKQISRPFTVAQKMKLSILIGEGLKVIHEKKYIHNDVKPANILLDNEDEPIFADFGSSKKLQDTSPITKLTQGYSDPQENNLCQCDIYSAGLIIYEIFSQQPPYFLNHFDHLIKDRKKQFQESYSQKIQAFDIPSCIKDILKKCFCPQGQRYSAHELVEALTKAKNQMCRATVPKPISKDTLFLVKCMLEVHTNNKGLRQLRALKKVWNELDKMRTIVKKIKGLNEINILSQSDKIALTYIVYCFYGCWLKYYPYEQGRENSLSGVKALALSVFQGKFQTKRQSIETFLQSQLENNKKHLVKLRQNIIIGMLYYQEPISSILKSMVEEQQLFYIMPILENGKILLKYLIEKHKIINETELHALTEINSIFNLKPTASSLIMQ